ncbi:hypothetical protein PLESTM_001730600 [Pleodorina starrii]|nr:hypothetical protein PLESTM_001730600 [Pleodorina starrii]
MSASHTPKLLDQNATASYLLAAIVLDLSHAQPIPCGQWARHNTITMPAKMPAAHGVCTHLCLRMQYPQYGRPWPSCPEQSHAAANAVATSSQPVLDAFMLLPT